MREIGPAQPKKGTRRYIGPNFGLLAIDYTQGGDEMIGDRRFFFVFVGRVSDVVLVRCSW